MTVADVEGVSVDTRHWIDGKRVASARTFDDISPIDETVIATVLAGGQREVDGWKPATTARSCARIGAGSCPGWR